MLWEWFIAYYIHMLLSKAVESSNWCVVLIYLFNFFPHGI